MEQRVISLESRKAGGNAGKRSQKYSISIPNRWVRELGLDNAQLEISQGEDEKIIIQKRLPYNIDDFLMEARAAGHKVRVYHYYDGEILCSKIAADFTVKQVAVANYVEDMIKTAFGVNQKPTWTDFLTFLEDRSIPRTRTNVAEYLKALNLVGYDPIRIVEKTQGRMMEDSQWIEML